MQAITPLHYLADEQESCIISTPDMASVNPTIIVLSVWWLPVSAVFIAVAAVHTATRNNTCQQKVNNKHVTWNLAIIATTTHHQQLPGHRQCRYQPMHSGFIIITHNMHAVNMAACV